MWILINDLEIRRIHHNHFFHKANYTPLWRVHGEKDKCVKLSILVAFEVNDMKPANPQYSHLQRYDMTGIEREQSCKLFSFMIRYEIEEYFYRCIIQWERQNSFFFLINHIFSCLIYRWSPFISFVRKMLHSCLMYMISLSLLY
jgi:hypothetical protein